MRATSWLALLLLGARPALAAGPASLSAVRTTFPTWGSATRAGEGAPCTAARIVDGGVTDSITTGYFGQGDTNLIVWRRGLCSKVVPSNDACLASSDCSSKYGCWDDTVNNPTSGSSDLMIIALTTLTYVSATGEIFDADMELQDWDGTAGSLVSPSNPLGNLDGWYFTCVDPPGGPGPPLAACPSGVSSPSSTCTCTDYAQSNCIYMDVRNTVTHELGHVLGLAHPNPYTGATMSATAPPGETSKRVLTPSDVNGICTVYPVGYVPSNACVTTGNQGTFAPPDGYWQRMTTIQNSTAGCALWWRNPVVTMVVNQYGAGPSCGDPAPPRSAVQAATSGGGCATAGSEPALLSILLGALALRRARRRGAARSVSSTRRAPPG